MSLIHSKTKRKLSLKEVLWSLLMFGVAAGIFAFDLFVLGVI